MLVKWNPITPTLFTELENAIRSNWLHDGDAVVTFEPRVDVIENKERFEIRAELPGLKKEDVKITLENNVLALSGEKRFEAKDEGRNYHTRETRYGKFERSFRLADNIDRAGIQANYSDGVLTVTLPKTKEAQPKTIEINVK